MFLVEKTFSVAEDRVESDRDFMMNILVKEIKAWLEQTGGSVEKYNKEGPEVKKMRENKQILFDANHYYRKDGKAYFRSVMLFDNENSYRRFMGLIGYPGGVDEDEMPEKTFELEINREAIPID